MTKYVSKIIEKNSTPRIIISHDLWIHPGTTIASHCANKLRSCTWRRQIRMVEHRVEQPAGKRARAVSSVDDMPAAQESSSVEVVEVISPAVDTCNAVQNDNVVDLYSVGHEKVTREMCNKGSEVPFQHTLRWSSGLRPLSKLT